MNEPKLERCPGPWTAVLMTSHKSRAYGATYYKVVDKNRNNVCCYIADKKTAELIADTWASRAPLPDNKVLTVEELREMENAISYRKHMMIEVNEDDERFCPRCQEEIVGYYTEYCEHCGQAVESPPEKGE